MGVVRSGHFWQLGSITSLATETTETTGGEILAAFCPKHGRAMAVPVTDKVLRTLCLAMACWKHVA